MSDVDSGIDLVAIAPDLRAAFVRNDFDVDGIVGVLGAAAHAALDRGEPVPARIKCAGAGELGALIRLFLLNDPVPPHEAAGALAPLTLADATAAGLLEYTADGVRALLDVRPVDFGSGSRWVLADLDDTMARRTLSSDHVLGVGHATHSLLRATPTAPVRTLLDLGTGCGVQAMYGCEYAGEVTATDVSPHALRLARAGAALNELSIEFLEGSWFEPVAGRQFDQIVANPPFVVGAARIEHTYRDSGLDLDGASALVVGGAPEHLAPGGTAAMLAAWVHKDGQDWQSRVASWLPDHGIDAWVVQRDVAEPELYVGTWLRDAGLDPRDAHTQAKAAEWLAHLRDSGVRGIGFGFVFLRRIDGPTEVVAEDLTHAYDDPLGPEAHAYFERSAWLREHDLGDARFGLDPATALTRVSVPGDAGWVDSVWRVHRGNGPNWQHEVDETGAALLAGMRHDGLPLSALVDLLSLADAGSALDEAELRVNAYALAEGLFRHGLIGVSPDGGAS